MKEEKRIGGEPFPENKAVQTNPGMDIVYGPGKEEDDPVYEVGKSKGDQKLNFERLATHQTKYQRLFQSADRDYIIWSDGWQDGAKYVWDNLVEAKNKEMEQLIEIHHSQDDDLKKEFDSLRAENERLKKELETKGNSIC